MAQADNLVFPRVGADRELKKAFEAYRNGEIDQAALKAIGGAELTLDQGFNLNWEALLDDVREARAQDPSVKPVIIGPLTYLWLGTAKDDSFDTLELLDRLVPIYGEILGRLAGQGEEWVQIDEPILCLDLPQDWKNAFERAYHSLQYSPLKKLIATYDGALAGNLGLAVSLPVAGLHIDLSRAPEQLPTLLDRLPTYKVLSLGVGNGRRTDPETVRELLNEAQLRFADNLWMAA